VHGVRTHDCYNNVFASAKGEIVYHAAAVGIVYDKRSHTQRHFEGHGDDIISLHMHPDGVLVATGEIGKSPKVIVWSSADCKPHAVLTGLHSRGVNNVAFSREGNRLATVGLDDNHTVAVWKWKTSDLIASAKGHGDKILSASWAPGDAYLVTCGVKHIKFWLLLGNTLAGGAGRFGATGSIQTVIDTAFAADGRCYTAVASGAIYEWVNATPPGSTRPAFKCARVVVPEGGSGHTGPVFGLAETKAGFATGGKDGKLCYWDANWRQTSVVKLPLDPRGETPCVRAAAWAANAGSLIIACVGRWQFLLGWLCLCLLVIDCD
jgi:WD40 repeat protein